MTPTVRWLRTTLTPKRGQRVILCLCLVWLPASATAQQAPETGVSALVRQLKDPQEDARVRAADALGKLGPEAKKAVPDLRGTLNDDRREAVQADVWPEGMRM